MKTSNSVLKQALRAPKRHMMKTGTSAALGLAMLLLGNAAAWAADKCFLDESGGGVIRGKNFSFPAAGACKAFQGHLLANPGGLISGSACGTSDNVGIRFNLNFSLPDGAFGVMAFHIDRLYSDIDKAGYGYYTIAHAGYGGDGWTVNNFNVHTIPCPSLPLQ